MIFVNGLRNKFFTTFCAIITAKFSGGRKLEFSGGFAFSFEVLGRNVLVGGVAQRIRTLNLNYYRLTIEHGVSRDTSNPNRPVSSLCAKNMRLFLMINLCEKCLVF